MKKRIGAVILGVLLTTALMGVTVFAASSSKIVSGATGTYVKGSKKAHQIVVETSVMSEAKSLEMDGKRLEEGKEYTLTDSMRPEPSSAPTTEAPAPTTEAPAPTTEAPAPTPSPAPTTEAPAPIPSSAPTTEAPAPTPSPAPTTAEAPAPSKAPTTSEAPVATSKAPTTEAPATNSNIFAPIQVQAEEVATRTLTYTISGEYLETLSLGEHKVAVNVYGADGLETLNAAITVVAQQTTTSETPVTSQAPTSENPATATTQTSQTSTTEEEDEDEADDDAASTTKKKNNTTSSKKPSKKSKSSKTGDSSQIILYLAIALVSGCAIVYFARKKTAK